jgi:hypothetical protein
MASALAEGSVIIAPSDGFALSLIIAPSSIMAPSVGFALSLIIAPSSIMAPSEGFALWVIMASWLMVALDDGEDFVLPQPASKVAAMTAMAGMASAFVVFMVGLSCGLRRVPPVQVIRGRVWGGWVSARRDQPKVKAKASTP